MAVRRARSLLCAAALLMALAPGCSVTVPGLDLPGEDDTGVDLGKDPGKDPGVPDLPGEDHAGQDTAKPDPGKDEGEDVPDTDPCGATLNPTCTLAACDDGDAGTVDDQCTLATLGEKQVCLCRGLQPPQDACGAALNPTCSPVSCLREGDVAGICSGVSGACACEPPADDCSGLFQTQCYDTIACDDGRADTTADRCRWDATTTPPACRCTGDVVVTDPCHDPLNPETCAPRACDLDGGPGICGWETGESVCSCGRVDPCGQRLQRCDPVQCYYKGDILGQCDSGTLLDCKCVESAYPPCGSKLNPTCSSYECDRGDGILGRCRPDRLGLACECVDVRTDDCSDIQNPQCKPNACSLLGGSKGQCSLGPLGHCGCFPGTAG